MEVLVSLAGLVAGLVFGATVQRTNFCTMGAVADIVLLADWRRMRAWLLAIAIALIGSQALALAGIVDLGRSAYRATDAAWPLVALGGLIFGFGMTMTGGCVSKNIVRLGGGNLKSALVLAVFALVAAATIAALALAHPYATPAESSLAWPGAMLTAVVAVLAGGALLVFCLKDRAFRRSRRDLIAGAVLGSLVAALWLLPALAPMSRPELLNFVAPVSDAAERLLGVAPAGIGFGVLAVVGTALGAFAAARLAGSFRIERFAGREDVHRHLTGAAMMGFGGALAMGCTIGQGLTGLSTLAPASIVAFLAMLAGGVAGVRYLEHGSLRGAVRALFASG